jgi:hypothetical protein
MSFYGTFAAPMAALLLLAACASSPPPAAVSQGAVSVVEAAELDAPKGTPEFNGARIGRDNLRSRIQD